MPMSLPPGFLTQAGVYMPFGAAPPSHVQRSGAHDSSTDEDSSRSTSRTPAATHRTSAVAPGLRHAPYHIAGDTAVSVGGASRPTSSSTHGNDSIDTRAVVLWQPPAVTDNPALAVVRGRQLSQVSAAQVPAAASTSVPTPYRPIVLPPTHTDPDQAFFEDTDEEEKQARKDGAQVTKRKNTDFHVYATMKYPEPVASNLKTLPKTKKTTQTLDCALFKKSRSVFLDDILTAHGIKTLYVPSADGPPFLLWFGASKSQAPTIRTDDEFVRAIRPLLKNRVTRVDIEFDTKGWTHWQSNAALLTGQTVQLAVAPPPPAAASTSATRASGLMATYGSRAELMMSIKEALWCERHREPCFIDGLAHHKLSNFHIKNIAIDIELGRGSIQQPAKETLQAIKRTRTSYPRIEPVEAAAVVGQKRARSPSPLPRSSSPPAVLDDQLHIALNKFSQESPLLTPNEIQTAHAALKAKNYVPQAFISISVDRVAAVTGLDEGKAAALHAFCVKWSSDVEGKRKRRRRA